MMRSNDNLKKFGHVTKTRQERANYTDQVNSTVRDLNGNQDSFDETLPKDQTSGNPEEIKTTRSPYVSWSTWFTENKKNIAIIGIVLPILGWTAYTFIDYGRDLSTLDANYSNLKNDVAEVKSKYDNINDKSIRADVLLELIQKDIDRINQRLVGTSAN